MSIEKIQDLSEEDWLTVNPKNRKLMADFLKQSTNLSDQTLKQYESALRIFFWYLKENCEDKHITEVRPRDFLAYQNYLVERGMSSSGVRLKRSAVSSLNGYLEVYYQEDFPQFRNFINKKIIAPPANPVHEKEPLTLEEYHHLCEELEKMEMWQQLAYLSFSFSSGARRNEVRQLLKEVINYEGKTFEINGNSVTTYLTHTIRCKGRGKRGKERHLQFDSEPMKWIKKWLEIRGDDDCKFVFATKRKGKMVQVSENTFNLWTEKYFTPIVGRRFHPHAIRSSRVTSMIVEGGRDISVAQKLLGHQSSNTTQIYLIKKDKDDSDDAFG